MTVNEIQNTFLEFKLYSDAECDKILEYVENLEDTNYTIKLDNKFYERGCSMKSADLVVNESTQWIFDKVKEKIQNLFEVEWIDNPHAVFRRYVPGDYFLEHKDNVDKTGADRRYFTVTVQLSSYNDYSGATVTVNRNTRISKHRGMAAIWGSNVPHEVSILTTGSRTSLIFFVSSKHIKFNTNSLI